MSDYNDALQSFKEKAKQLPSKTPMQVAVPNPKKNTEPEAQLNVQIPKRLLQAIKLQAVQGGIHLKDLVTDCLEHYLEQRQG